MGSTLVCCSRFETQDLAAALEEGQTRIGDDIRQDRDEQAPLVRALPVLAGLSRSASAATLPCG